MDASNINLNLPKGEEKLKPLWNIPQVERRGMLLGTATAIVFGIGAYYVVKPLVFPPPPAAPPPVAGFPAVAPGAGSPPVTQGLASAGPTAGGPAGSTLELTMTGGAPEAAAPSTTRGGAGGRADGDAEATGLSSGSTTGAGTGATGATGAGSTASTSPGAGTGSNRSTTSRPGGATTVGSVATTASTAATGAAARNPGTRKDGASTRGTTPATGDSVGGAARVTETAICLEIQNRSPAKRLSSVKLADGKVFCWIRVLGAEGHKVRHVWVLNGKHYPGIWLEIQSPNWRTWGSKRLEKGMEGNARVDIEDESGKVLATLPFQIAAR
ncbi:MAG: DUF2914 domain-containing protein [Planctomycetes bacterium]|nr:DUF2914 domain-containing protein [Planctomycetota bacterium]